MWDFVSIETKTKRSKDGATDCTVYPLFLVRPSRDLMIKGGDFKGVWDYENHIWSLNQLTVARLLDDEIRDKVEELTRMMPEANVHPIFLSAYKSRSWTEFQQYCKSLPDSDWELDENIAFASQTLTREDHISKRLSYDLSDSGCPAYDELMSVLYAPGERQKIEWFVGSIFAGDSTSLQKFLVLYGSAGTGKSTVINIMTQLLEDYAVPFDAKSLSSSSNSFSMEQFRSRPLLAYQHDGDLSRIKDNTKLNSIVSHEPMIINEKRKTQYYSKILALLVMGSNRPVTITEAKSGLLRRLISVNPSGEKVPPATYDKLMNQIRYESGAIAKRCLDVYLELGFNAYDSFRAKAMMDETNHFYTFMYEHFDTFNESYSVQLQDVWKMYKAWADDVGVQYRWSMMQVRDELKSYFTVYHERMRAADGTQLRKVYSGFRRDMFDMSKDEAPEYVPDYLKGSLVLDKTVSIFDEVCAEYPAQYANELGKPSKPWSRVKDTLSDIETDKTHYVRVPENHIVVDFDYKDSEGNKDLQKNLEMAAKWPATYAETSNSGGGVHLHYIYDGDIKKLANRYNEDVEIKVFTGKQSLRRRLTRCNDHPISTISSGLPMKKGENKVIDFEGLKNEKALRTLIEKNLRKEIHPGTKPSVDFIFKIVEDAYQSGMQYDISDMKQDINVFATNSTHHAVYCSKLVSKMHYKSDEPRAVLDDEVDTEIFFDVEVFPNLFVISWKRNLPVDQVYSFVNPTPDQVANLCRAKLIGFNNRRYDNHILYAAMLGYTNEELYELSQGIINHRENAMFREAYSLSYADIYDYASAAHKQSLKKWEIELGILHMEMELPWDQPVPKDLWNRVTTYCENDVRATEALYHHIYSDFVARKILADLSGLRVNDPTRLHMTKIIFGDDPDPKSKLVYTDLSEMFPGYSYDAGVSTYRGETTGEGGYVYAEPGMYFDVALYDVASMHPASIIALNYLGPYTQTYADIRQARIYIKHGDHEAAGELLDGKLKPFLDDPDISDKDLADAMKTALNSLYGYTKAGFDCAFKHPLNKDNIVAKRGALFMVDLKHEVQDIGFQVVHIKTDSIKVPNPTQELEDHIFKFAEKYGYEFEHEATYDRLCLVNNAVYICHDKTGWHATGAQFAVPYVFKTLFTHEELIFDDYCVTKAVQKGDIYVEIPVEGKEEPDRIYIGRVGRFVPVKDGYRYGGTLVRKTDEGKYHAVQGTKGYIWAPADTFKVDEESDYIDDSYFQDLCEEAINAISEHGDFEKFVNVKE